MGINKVDQKSVNYKLVWLVVKFFHHFVFYKKIEVSNLERLPQKGATVFTPNHQNALMDALAVLFSLKKRLVFLARADIFKKNFVAEILYFLRILPVYRPRDGQGEVKKNQETFKKTTEVLKKNLGLVIFPEGTHIDKQSLMPLKKGFAKIAFQTEEASNFKLGIELVPVAITYSSYEQSQSTLSINFGESIPLKDHYESYHEHPAKAFNEIRDRMTIALKSIMIHIDDDGYYENNNFLVKALAKKFAGSQQSRNQILSGKVLINKINSLKQKNKIKHDELQAYTRNFLKTTNTLSPRQQYQFKYYTPLKFIFKFIEFLILIPIFLIASAPHLFSYLFAYIPTKRVADKQFHSSFRFLIFFLSIFIMYVPMYFIFQWIYPEYGLLYFTFFYVFSLFISSWMLDLMRNFLAVTAIFIFSIVRHKAYKMAKLDLKYITDILKNVDE
jgi:1-acyl-sn-glycerol-3-phosphate acyltransferase